MAEQKTIAQNVAVEKNDRREVTVTGDIPAETAAAYRGRALKKLGKDIEVPGFRKGHVPEHMLADHIGAQKLWEEIAEMAIADAYPDILAEQQLAVIGRPHVSITKLAPDNPISFRIEAALEPEVSLPDYKAIASEVMQTPRESTEVTERDVTEAVLGLRKNKWLIDHPEEAKRGVEPKPDELPELTDELVRGLGNFTGVDDFTTKLRENLKLEKERKAREKKRIEIGEKIVSGATIALPRMLVEGELNGMLAQLQADVKRIGITWDEYLKRVGKSEEDIRRSWHADAERRAKLQLVLNEIARTENIRPKMEDINRQVERLKGQVEDASEQQLRAYVATVLQNDAVFQFLEQCGGTLSEA